MIVEIEVEGGQRTVDVRREGAEWVVAVDGRVMTATAVEVDGRWSLLLRPAHAAANPDEGVAGPAKAGHYDPGVVESAFRRTENSTAWRSYEVSFESADEGVTIVRINGDAVPIRVADPRPRFRRGQRDAAASGEGRRAILAPMPGRVVKVLVERGQAVAARQGVVVVEAMKMENELRAPRAGTVSEVLVSEGMSVEAHAVLVVLE